MLMELDTKISMFKSKTLAIGVSSLLALTFASSNLYAQPVVDAPASAPNAPIVSPSAVPDLPSQEQPAGNLRLIPRNSNLNDALGPSAADDIIPPLPQVGAPIASPVRPSAPTRPPTPEEIAREIAPNFNVSTDYNRLVQCYGTADYMAAFTRVRSNRPGATPQIRSMANQIAGIKNQMQPFVLATSTVRTEARFRSDYDRVARNLQNQIANSRNPDPIVQAQLRTLNACQADIRRWRGGQ